MGFSARAELIFLKTLERTRFGSLRLTTSSGRVHSFSGDASGPAAELHLHSDDVLLKTLLRGDIGLAEDYIAGRWDSADLASLAEFMLFNSEALGSFLFGTAASRLLSRIRYLCRANTLRGSRKNIEAHYDLGNDFYRLWLDSSLTYSSALFSSSSETLYQGQMNKYDRIIDRAGRGPKEILEVGCGWGGFAERAACTQGHRIKCITVSPKQHSYASKRLEPFSSNVEVSLEDYREQKGSYDSIVSIEMFEAVGEKYWPLFFQSIKSLLRRKGRALIQTISIGDEFFEDYRRGGDLIRTYIFPGGMLPSPARFAGEAMKAGLQVVERYSFGRDYARTLEFWLQAFDENRQGVLRLGFNESFIRLWRLYLASCIGAFRCGRTDVAQWELAHA